MKTKEKIIVQAIKLFNKQGLKNVRLQHVADQCGISVGNLAYHFPEHSQFVSGVIQFSLTHLNQDLKNWKKINGLIDFDNVLIQLHEKAKKQSFIFCDLLEIKRSYKHEFKQINEYLSKLKDALFTWFINCLDTGILKKELTDAMLNNSADEILKRLHHYIYRAQLEGRQYDEIIFRRNVWEICLPLLTDIGNAEYDILISPKFI